ncbi:MAG: hypothetical protein PUD29_04425 [Treponema porcinum]|uniref:hypothetical protein n=1 Tax=Treponema porcinum TaxID=261392 RepID=UPI0024094119|nr:hypothetical protein [Treponema porcinum]MDD6899239.1 hypothetical protein [Treponema porcinum]
MFKTGMTTGDFWRVVNPKMDVLKKRRRELAEKRKALYAEYRTAQQDMRELTAAKGNLDHLYRATEGRGHKAQER